MEESHREPLRKSHGDPYTEPYSRVYAEINLDNIIKNMEALAANLPAGTGIIGVVKTDGYGHGAVPVAKTIEPFVCGYAVAAVEEGLILRRHGVTKPVLVLGSTHRRHYEEMLKYEISPTIFEYEKAEALSKIAVSMRRTASIHIAVDTGMSRIGYPPGEDSLIRIGRIHSLPGIRVDGIFTHFSKADESDKAFTELQYQRFRDFADELERRGVHIPSRHCSNSAAILDLPQMGLNAVRAGIAMYGIYPSGEVTRKLKLWPAMEIRSFVTYVKEIGPGTCVSYGGTFKAQRNMRVATIGTGYGDGYPRSLSGRGYVLLHGKRAPILGRICMDQFMVDVTDIPETAEDDRVTLVGRDGEEELSMERLAGLCNGFCYEIPCVLGKRVPRVYKRNGTIIGCKDYHDDSYGDFL